MAHYLLRIDDEYQIIEAESAKRAADDPEVDDATIEVWTLRSGEPRVYQITTESVRTVKLV